MNTQHNGFVYLQSEFESQLLSINSIKKIHIEMETDDNCITCISLFINDEHWDAFDCEKISANLGEALQIALLQKISSILNEKNPHIDMDLLIKKCKNNLK